MNSNVGCSKYNWGGMIKLYTLCKSVYKDVWLDGVSELGCVCARVCVCVCVCVRGKQGLSVVILCFAPRIRLVSY